MGEPLTFLLLGNYIFHPVGSPNTLPLIYVVFYLSYSIGNNTYFVLPEKLLYVCWVDKHCWVIIADPPPRPSPFQPECLLIEKFKSSCSGICDTWITADPHPASLKHHVGEDYASASCCEILREGRSGTCAAGPPLLILQTMLAVN